MTDANDRQSEIIAKIAFFLMIGGWLVQPIIALLVFLLPGSNLSDIVGLLLAGSLFSRKSWLWSWGLFLGSIALGWLR